jgi:energy-coupling factor transport system permease protein
VVNRLHPAAWWIWAVGLAVAASRTTNPFLLGLVLAVTATVVASCRTDAPWARSFRGYVLLGAFVVVVRVIAYVLVGSRIGATVLVELPELGLGDWAASVRLGGPVTAEGLLTAAADGLRLATILICFGAASSLADPRRMLRLVPTSLHEIGTAVVVTLTIAPQLVQSVGRVRRARRLRAGRDTGRRAVRGVAVPVLADALDRSLWLAASMDVRGHGRTGEVPASRRRLTAGLVLTGLLGACIGAYGLLDGTTPTALGLPTMLAGAGLATAGLLVARGRVRPTVLRPDRWTLRATVVAGGGLAAAVGTFLSARSSPDSVVPALDTLAWPALPWLAVGGTLLALLPALVAPATPGRAGERPASVDPGARSGPPTGDDARQALRGERDIRTPEPVG